MAKELYRIAIFFYAETIEEAQELFNLIKYDKRAIEPVMFARVSESKRWYFGEMDYEATLEPIDTDAYHENRE